MTALRWVHSLSIGIEGFDDVGLTPDLIAQGVTLTTSKASCLDCTCH